MSKLGEALGPDDDDLSALQITIMQGGKKIRESGEFLIKLIALAFPDRLDNEVRQGLTITKLLDQNIIQAGVSPKWAHHIMGIAIKS